MAKAYGYYKSKADCIKAIERTIRQNPVKRDVIYYFIMADHGFGKKQADEMIDILLDAGIIEETKTGVLKGVL